MAGPSKYLFSPQQQQNIIRILQQATQQLAEETHLNLSLSQLSLNVRASAELPHTNNGEPIEASELPMISFYERQGFATSEYIFNDPIASTRTSNVLPVLRRGIQITPATPQRTVARLPTTRDASVQTSAAQTQDTHAPEKAPTTEAKSPKQQRRAERQAPATERQAPAAEQQGTAPQSPGSQAVMPVPTQAPVTPAAQPTPMSEQAATPEPKKSKEQRRAERKALKARETPEEKKQRKAQEKAQKAEKEAKKAPASVPTPQMPVAVSPQDTAPQAQAAAPTPQVPVARPQAAPKPTILPGMPSPTPKSHRLSASLLSLFDKKSPKPKEPPKPKELGARKKVKFKVSAPDDKQKEKAKTAHEDVKPRPVTPDSTQPTPAPPIVKKRQAPQPPPRRPVTSADGAKKPEPKTNTGLQLPEIPTIPGETGPYVIEPLKWETLPKTRKRIIISMIDNMQKALNEHNAAASVTVKELKIAQMTRSLAIIKEKMNS